VTFAALGLPRPLVNTLARQGIETPFPIQTATIPDALAGRDVLGRGQTGSGKTLAFGLPLLSRVAGTGAAPRRPRALVLVPTRELAFQVNDALAPLAMGLCVRTKTAVGGTSYDKQIDALRRGVEVLVATPGRLMDLVERGVCALDGIEITVLDEADQMCDMGFLPAIRELLDLTPRGGQRLLFSATLDGDVDTLVRDYLHEPVTHEIDPPVATVDTMDHHLLMISPREKFDVLASIANRQGRTIMFTRTKDAVDRIVDQLAGVGVRAAGLHGGKTQRVRTRTLAEFREGRTGVLVATDVAARGIHVDSVSLVVHIDPPKDPKDYLHRAGRTARAGESGTVVTLVLPRQRRLTHDVLGRAGVSPTATRVTPGDAALAEVTGARRPSGEPVVPERRDRPRSGGRPPSEGRRPFRGHDGGERRPYRSHDGTDRHQAEGRRPYHARRTG